MNNLWLFLIMGLSSGLISGLVGLAGGFILIPFLVLVSGLSQHAAQGTYLAAIGPPGYLFGSAGLLPEWLRSAKTGSHNEYWSLPGDTGRFVSRSIHQRYGPKAYLRRSASPSQPQIDFFTLKQLKDIICINS